MKDSILNSWVSFNKSNKNTSNRLYKTHSHCSLSELKNKWKNYNILKSYYIFDTKKRIN